MIPSDRIALLLALATAIGVVLATADEPPAQSPFVVSVGGPADDPAYLPVYAAAALGTFEAEGVRPVLRRAKHPTAAVAALRDHEAAVAATTLDQAIRGAWVRGTAVRVLVAHTRAPAAALTVPVARVQDLRGKRVGIPGPGTTGHLLLAALLRPARIEPWQLELLNLPGAALVARVASGDLAAAVVDEPWVGRALATGTVTALIDFRDPEESTRRVGGPFYEVVSVTASAESELGSLEPALAAFARALIRVQTWLATTPPDAVAERLPADLAPDRQRFVGRLAALQRAYAPGGEATEAGLAASLSLLRAGTPLPVSLKVAPADLREPAFISAARARLGREPPPP